MGFGETLVAMTALLLGGTAIILPIMILAIRYAIRPLVDAWAAARVPGMPAERVSQLEGRIDHLEQQISLLESRSEEMLEKKAFDLQLTRGQ